MLLHVFHYYQRRCHSCNRHRSAHFHCGWHWWRVLCLSTTTRDRGRTRRRKIIEEEKKKTIADCWVLINIFGVSLIWGEQVASLQCWCRCVVSMCLDVVVVEWRVFEFVNAHNLDRRAMKIERRCQLGRTNGDKWAHLFSSSSLLNRKLRCNFVMPHASFTK